MRPIVSVVIVNWNTRDLTCTCVRSVLRNSSWAGHRQAELIVVDNASFDGSVQALEEEFGNQLKLIENSQNEGFARACNRGLKECSGSYVLLLNPDSELGESSIEQLVGYLESNPEAGILGPRLVDEGGRRQPSCYPLPTLAREFWRLLHLDRLYSFSAYPLEEWGDEQPRQVECVQGACLLMRRELVEQVGTFDEAFFVYSEEMDLCFRSLAAGWEVHWVPQVCVLHHGGRSTEQIARKMFLELYRTKLHYFRKHKGRLGGIAYKFILLIASLPRVTLPILMFPWSVSQRKRWLSLLGNYGALVRQLPIL